MQVRTNALRDEPLKFALSLGVKVALNTLRILALLQRSAAASQSIAAPQHRSSVIAMAIGMAARTHA